MKIYAFDCDETLDCSSGPVALFMLCQLRDEDHILGICGNWAKVCHYWPGWSRLFSFIGPMAMTKELFLSQISRYIPAEDYVMVGNSHRLGQTNSPDDETAAQRAGWRFILAQDFAVGQR